MDEDVTSWPQRSDDDDMLATQLSAGKYQEGGVGEKGQRREVSKKWRGRGN